MIFTVRLYEELIVCSGVAVLEWLIAYCIATQRSTLVEKIETHVMPRPTVFSFLKTIFVISDKVSNMENYINSSNLGSWIFHHVCSTFRP